MPPEAKRKKGMGLLPTTHICQGGVQCQGPHCSSGATPTVSDRAPWGVGALAQPGPLHHVRRGCWGGARGGEASSKEHRDQLG